MRCSRCGYNNPDGVEFCEKCSARLSAEGSGARPSWNLVKGPQWTNPDFSADSITEDDIPYDFDPRPSHVSFDDEPDRRAAAASAAAAAAERARIAAEQAAAKRREESYEAPAERGEDEPYYDEEFAAEQVRPRGGAVEYEDDDFDDLPDDSSRKSGGKGIGPFLGNLFSHKKKPAAKTTNAYNYDDDYDEDENYNVKPYKKNRKSTKSGSGSGKGLTLAIKIAGIVAVLAIIAIGIWLISSGVKNCREAANSPVGTVKAPVIEQNPEDDTSYFVTVYAKEGKQLVFETADGARKEVTVPSSGFVKFKVFVSSLMPNEPVEGAVYQATPKIYVKNDDGTETLIDGYEPPYVIINVPAINVKFDCADTIVSDDGKVEITGRVDLIASKLTIDGEDVYINPDGTFSHTVVFEDTGDYVINAEATLAGHQIYRHSFNVTVSQATTTETLIQFPWEYGDTAFSQRIKNASETIEVTGRVPEGSTVTASCSSTNATLTTPVVSDDGSFKFSVTMALAGDYTIDITCTTTSGVVSERQMHVQRAPEWSTYTQGAWAMNYESFSYASTQAYKISGKVTEIIQEGDYILAVLEIEGGKTLVLEYHNHYSSAGSLAVGSTHTAIYGRPMGMNADGIPQIYVWFVDD